ncbi:MAG: cell division protein FtsL [Proteobacteria bacterium]|nr:MAG: cell division protein FtsL [Pseudomonadota bacterium]
MLKAINIILTMAILITSFFVINQRYLARQSYMQLNSLQNQAENLNKEYTRLQLEEGTYSSGLAVNDFAAKNLGLVQPDQKHVVDIK